MRRMRHLQKLAPLSRPTISKGWVSKLAGIVCLGLASLSGRQCMAQDSSLFDPGIFNEAERMLDFNAVELGIQLKKGLRVFQPEQELFIDKVLLEVERRRLSRSMVNVLYLWALRRNPKVPFPYFEFVMREMAKQRGVNL